MNNRFDRCMDWIADRPWLIFVFLGFVILFVIAVVMMEDDNQAACLAAGYPEYRYGNGVVYCIKRVNQSDVVVPLRDLQRR